MIDKEEIIQNFVRNFIQKDKRERCLLELMNPKKRSNFTDKLNHKWDTILDMRYLTKIEKSADYSDGIKELLNFKSNEYCYIISNYDEFDGLLTPFNEVFDALYSKGFGSIIMNVSGSIIFLTLSKLKVQQSDLLGAIINSSYQRYCGHY